MEEDSAFSAKRAEKTWAGFIPVACVFLKVTKMVRRMGRRMGRRVSRNDG